jgi:hypothetical protein
VCLPNLPPQVEKVGRVRWLPAALGGLDAMATKRYNMQAIEAQKRSCRDVSLSYLFISHDLAVLDTPKHLYTLRLLESVPRSESDRLTAALGT